MRPHPAALRLRSILDRLASALATVNIDTLLACEAELAAALADLGGGRLADEPSREATVRELAAARSALTRCRRLGATIGDLTRMSMAARGDSPAYGRQGETRPTTRVHSLEAKV